MALLPFLLLPMPRFLQGITVLETLIVVVVLGLLAAFVLPRLRGVKEKSGTAAVKNDLRNLATAQEIYLSQHERYAANPLSELAGFSLSSNVELLDHSADQRFWRAHLGHTKTDISCYMLMEAANESAGQVQCAREPTLSDSTLSSPPAFDESFTTLDTQQWGISDRPFGRGELEQENVRLGDDLLELVIPAGTYNGGETFTQDVLPVGTAQVRMKMPSVPGAFSTFFLYTYENGAHEIDMEFWSDGTRRLTLAAWQSGEKVHHRRFALPFDPTDGWHIYTISWTREQVKFFADGIYLQQWQSPLPQHDMKLYMSTWWPTWQSGDAPPTEKRMQIDWVRYSPHTF